MSKTIFRSGDSGLPGSNAPVPMARIRETSPDRFDLEILGFPGNLEISGQEQEAEGMG